MRSRLIIQFASSRKLVIPLTWYLALKNVNYNYNLGIKKENHEERFVTSLLLAASYCCCFGYWMVFGSTGTLMWLIMFSFSPTFFCPSGTGGERDTSHWVSGGCGRVLAESHQWIVSSCPVKFRLKFLLYFHKPAPFTVALKHLQFKTLGLNSYVCVYFGNLWHGPVETSTLMLPSQLLFPSSVCLRAALSMDSPFLSAVPFHVQLSAQQVNSTQH